MGEMALLQLNTAIPAKTKLRRHFMGSHSAQYSHHVIALSSKDHFLVSLKRQGTAGACFDSRLVPVECI